MKKLLMSFLLIISTLCFADEIQGDWYGQLDVSGMKLRIVFHISQDNDNYTTLMDSPDQGATGLATTSTNYKDNALHVVMKNMGAEFKGIYINDTIDGTFSQAGMNIPLKLSKKAIEKAKVKPRVQDPIKPYAYQSEDIYFVNKNADGIKLAGTLTLPKNVNNPPVAIMISGSGPQNRDEEVKQFNHRPFLVWSDYLTKNGIAVLRFDDRGVAESQGSQKDATSADFATDVQAAVTYLRSRSDVINVNKIGLIGHSEGGFIAPMVASQDKNLAFIVLLAGTGVDGGEVLLTQTKRASELSNQDAKEIDFNERISKRAFDMVKKEKNLEKLKIGLKSLFEEVRKDNPDMMAEEMTNKKLAAQVDMLSSPWLSYFIRTNPDDFLSKVSCPVLAINGSLDFQVLADLNLNGIKVSLQKAQNKDVTIKKLEGLNHLFQTSETGALDEYAKIEETISPIALNLVANWINKRFKGKTASK